MGEGHGAEWRLPPYYAAVMNLAEQEVDILDHIRLNPDESLQISDLWMEIDPCRAFGGGRPYAYTTVATVVQNLRGKGAVENAGGRLDGYHPVYAPQARAGDQMDEAWKRAPDPDAAMQHFLSGMTEAELGRVERALASVRARPAARQEEQSVRERPAPQERPLSPALSGREQCGEDHNDDPDVLISGLLELQVKTRRTTKRAVANRIGIHEKTAANRMAGAAGLSSEVLGELAEALDTPDDIRAAIFRLAGRAAPSKKAVALGSLPTCPPTGLTWTASSTHPSCTASGGASCTATRHIANSSRQDPVSPYFLGPCRWRTASYTCSGIRIPPDSWEPGAWRRTSGTGARSRWPTSRRCTRETGTTPSSSTSSAK